MLYYKATAGCGVGMFVGVSARKRACCPAAGTCMYSDGGAGGGPPIELYKQYTHSLMYRFECSFPERILLCTTPHAHSHFENFDLLEY